MPTLAGKQVGETGYGLLGLTWRAEVIPDTQAFAVMKAALEHGANFWNGGEMYGSWNNNSLHLLRRYFIAHPEDATKVVLSIKSSPRNAGSSTSAMEVGIRRSVNECLDVLDGTKSIDVFQFARVDYSVPIEMTIGVLAKCVKEGKIGGIGLSEVQDSDIIRRAQSVHPIAAVEVEFSLWSRDILQNGVMDTCAELGIPIVAYSPLGHGFLAGQFQKPGDVPRGDMRSHLARLQPGAFEKNSQLPDRLKALADRRDCTLAQLALSWVRGFSERDMYPLILPIPGATTVGRVVENSKHVELGDEDRERVRGILTEVEIVGGRYW